MLYYLHLLKDQSEFFDFLNVFQYQTFRAAGAALTAFLISVLLGDRVILKLTSLKIGQPIRSYGVQAHLGKLGVRHPRHRLSRLSR